MKKLFIPVVLGTVRVGRSSEHVANFVVEQINRRDDMEAQLFDVRDMELPKNQYGTEAVGSVPEWQAAVLKADGIVVIAPEYNHSFPGTLKTFMDTLLKEYIHRAVGLVGVSAGPWGGTRVIESMVPMVRELGLMVTFTDLQFPFVSKSFDESGNMVDEKASKRSQKFLDELAWVSTSLKWGRDNLA